VWSGIFEEIARLGGWESDLAGTQRAKEIRMGVKVFSDVNTGWGMSIEDNKGSQRRKH